MAPRGVPWRIPRVALTAEANDSILALTRVCFVIFLIGSSAMLAEASAPKD